MSLEGCGGKRKVCSDSETLAPTILEFIFIVFDSIVNVSFSEIQ